jgi:chemotaxis protein CheD
MAEPERILEIFLQPGELYFGGRATRIRTILGSCVSLVVWHPHRQIGGMCHFMLPERVPGKKAALDGRYADEAMVLLLADIDKSGTHPREYRLKMFGGGNMFPALARGGARHIGARNVQAARELIARHGFKCVSEHVEGSGHRHLVFNVWNGVISLRHAPLCPDRPAGAPLFVPLGLAGGNGACMAVGCGEERRKA